MQQLAYIAEIAERLGKGEDVVLVVADFWGRGIKDHRGLPWGQVQHKAGKGTGNGFEWYWRATRWFHRMKHAGKLPPPYCDTAHTIPEPRRFTVEKRRKRPNAKPVIDEKAAWTAEQWREWFALEFPRPETLPRRRPGHRPVSPRCGRGQAGGMPSPAIDQWFHPDAGARALQTALVVPLAGQFPRPGLC